VTLLTDGDLRREVVDHNFKVGQRYYSMMALEQYLAPLMVRE